MKLIVVESPSKAKTIAEMLLQSQQGVFSVIATKGHLNNLPEKQHGVVRTQEGYEADWVVIDGKQKIIAQIAEEAKRSEGVYVATDGDIEGERIASDVVKLCRLDSIGVPVHRVVFHEITKSHILSVLHGEPGSVDDELVRAQAARRIIYREVGYPCSAILTEDMKRQRVIERTDENGKQIHLGTGNNIAPALAILCDNEQKIRDYTESKIGRIYCDYIIDGVSVRAYLRTKFGEEHVQQMRETVSAIRSARTHVVKVFKEKLDSERSPMKPLTTATLQRGAFYLYGFDEKKTMRLAQRLFEGVRLFGQRIGLITYMRTDSHRISDEAAEAAIQIVQELFGEDYTLFAKRSYSKTNEGAHECIRPSQFGRLFWPDNVRSEFEKLGEEGEELYTLYRFIYQRFLITQMKNARYDRSRMLISAGSNELEVQGNVQLYSGWMSISREIVANYHEASDEIVDREVHCPYAEEGEEIIPIDVDVMFRSTKQPPRYGRGRFLTTLSNHGIGKPSTIATIIPALEKYGYVVESDKMLVPTQLGMTVNDWHKEHCEWLCDLESAKLLEENLDKVAAGELGETALIDIFHDDVEALKGKMGYNPDGPTPAQVELAKRIASAKGQILDDDFYLSRPKVSRYIEANREALESLTRCPYCDKGEVYESPQTYRCTQKGCFTFFKKGGMRFFDNFKNPKSEAELTATVKQILQEGSAVVDGLVSKKGKRFAAKLSFKHNSEYHRYEFEMDYLGDERFARLHKESCNAAEPEIVVETIPTVDDLPGATASNDNDGEVGFAW